LHRSIYGAAICGVIHYYWLVKSDVRDPLFYGALVSILLLWRLGDWYLKKRRSAPAKTELTRASVNAS
jgi:methionine sulfoxide reductase heme-binding subunit